MRVILVILVCVVAAVQATKKFKKENPFCNASISDERAVKLEWRAFKYAFKRDYIPFNEHFDYNIQLLSNVNAELFNILHSIKVEMDTARAHVMAQLKPFLGDPLVPNARTANRTLDEFRGSVFDNIKFVNKKIHNTVNYFIGNFTETMYSINDEIIASTNSTVSQVISHVANGSPHARSCACKLLRNFILNSMDAFGLQSECGRVAIEDILDIFESLQCLLKTFRRAVLSPFTEISHCFYNTAREANEQTKTYLNFCLQTESNRLMDYSESLDRIAHDIIEFVRDNVKFVSHKLDTCSDVLVVEYLPMYQNFHKQYANCLGTVGICDDSYISNTLFQLIRDADLMMSLKERYALGSLSRCCTTC